MAFSVLLGTMRDERETELKLWHVKLAELKNSLVPCM